MPVRLAAALPICLILPLVATALPAAAQDAYPSRTIRLVVGFAAGGPTDIPARFIADRLGDRLGQRIIVENKTGAAGMLATRDVLAQPRDGYNLLLCTHFESINTAIYRNPQFGLSDLAPISLTSKYFYGLTIPNTVPADDWDAFVKYGRANPGKLSFANIGAGSAQDLFARQLERLTGIAMNAVPYRGGALALQDLLPGRVQFYVAPTANVLPLHEKKQLKVIAISSPERLKSAPDIPTLRDKGIDFVRFGWLGICAGSGTPEPILARLNKEIRAVVADPAYRALIEKSGSIPESSTPAELRKVIDQTLAEVEATVREFKLQRD
jgi:tripartite-type tricarboxylate transporter receptor subunit TctC